MHRLYHDPVADPPAAQTITVSPCWHHDRSRWIWMMGQSIGKVACHFNTQRMMRRYAAEAYLR